MALISMQCHWMLFLFAILLLFVTENVKAITPDGKAVHILV